MHGHHIQRRVGKKDKQVKEVRTYSTLTGISTTLGIFLRAGTALERIHFLNAVSFMLVTIWLIGRTDSIHTFIFALSMKGSNRINVAPNDRQAIDPTKKSTPNDDKIKTLSPFAR